VPEAAGAAGGRAGGGVFRGGVGGGGRGGGGGGGGGGGRVWLVWVGCLVVFFGGGGIGRASERVSAAGLPCGGRERAAARKNIRF